jgi:hypothetical protein
MTRTAVHKSERGNGRHSNGPNWSVTGIAEDEFRIFFPSSVSESNINAGYINVKKSGSVGSFKK